VHPVRWALAADWRAQAVCSLIISLNQGIRSDRAEADVSEYFNERQTRLMEVRRVCDRKRGYDVLTHDIELLDI